MSKVNDRQVAGEHYKSKFQHWDWVAALELPYLPAQVSKYIHRWKKKNGLQDLEKAKHFLEKFIEEETSKTAMELDYTKRFCTLNKVGTLETEILINLTLYNTGSLMFLHNALQDLELLIRMKTTPVQPEPQT